MSIPTDLRGRKRQAMRQTISDAATGLFIERGFDHVTIDEIAKAADVGRMTVFNYFPRKEDMFFDLDEPGREEIRAALAQRDGAISPIETLRRLAHRFVAEQRPFLAFSEDGERFLRTIGSSATLLARARAIRDELAAIVQSGLAACTGAPADDADAQLAAHLLVASWSVAYLQAHQEFQRSKDSAKAHATFLRLIDQGSAGVTAAMAHTPYG